MLDNHEISFGCLTTYLGFILGFTLLGLSEFVGLDHLGRWGVVALGLSCTYSIHRSLSSLGKRQLDAFNLGREYERTRDIAVVR